MAWIESHQTLAAHPKTRKLAHLLSVSKPAAIGHLHCLWWWAIDYTEDGGLERFDSLDIAIAGEWEGDPDAFVGALVKAGFLDESPDGHLSIHDWADYAGKLIERKKANAQRMRDARAAEKAASTAHGSGTNNERAAHVQRTDDARVERPNQTIPNQTKPDQTTGDKSPAPPRARKTANGRVDYSPEFEAFWQVYPSGHGVKKASYEHWKRIKPDAALAQEIIDGVHGWKLGDRWKRGFVMDAENFLKKQAWESVPPPQSADNITRIEAPSRPANASGQQNLTDQELDDIIYGRTG